MKRYNNLSLFRIVAFISIFLFHIFYILLNCDSAYIALFSSMTQGFALLSGFLYAQKKIDSYKNRVKKWFVTLFIPMLFSILIIVIFAFFLAFIKQDLTNFLTYFYGYRVFNSKLVIVVGNYYYPLYIFICYLLLPLFIKAREGNKVSKYILLTLFIDELIICFFIGSPLIFIPFALGYQISSKRFNDYVNPTSHIKALPLFLLIGIIGSVSLLILNVTYFKLTEVFIINRLKYFIEISLRTVFGISFTLLMFYMFRHINKEKESKLLRFTDNVSYYFFLFDEVFMVGGLNIVSPFASMTLGIIVSFFVTFISSLGSYVMSKFFINKLIKKSN